MRKLSIIAVLAALAFFGMACTKVEAMDGMARSAQNQQQWESEEIGNTVDLSEVDPSIMQFVETYFPQTGILYCHQTQNRYKVTLNDQTKLHFTLTPEWIKVDCEHSNIYTSVPAGIVPEQITAYVTTNFPNNFIEEIEKKSFGWEIELNHDYEIKFDADFNVISGGGNGGGGNGGGNNFNYPEINTFVDTYFPQVGILSTHQDGNEIEVKLTDKTEIDFYLTFEWKNIDCDESQVYGMVPTELVPTQITDYVVANFPNNHIDQIEKTNFGWEIELNNDHEIKFDADFNVISGGGNGGGGNGGGNNSNYPEINTFVDTYFAQVGIRKVERDGNKYEVELTDNTDIDFNLSFEWTKIDCDDSYVYGSVPTELVPMQIADYVTINFPNNHIDQIEKKYYGWDVELNNDHEIKFDHNFNVISGGGNGGGGNGGGGNGGGNNSNYPEINTFVGTYFPQASIRKVERDGNKYEVELTDNTDIDFNLSFEWKKIDCDDSNIYGSVPTELVPVQITDYVTANFPGKHIDSIEKKYNSWEIELSNGLEITFDANFNVTGFDDKK